MNKNIVLIGMPGAGKSTIGVLLAKTLLMGFTDTDLLVQKQYSMSLCEIIEKYGTDKFLQIENDVICSSELSNSVIATGGSAVYGKSAMRFLKSNGIVVYLQLPEEEIENRLNDITTRGVAMKNGNSISDLYKERTPLYENNADIAVDCSGMTPEQCVEIISEKINNKI